MRRLLLLLAFALPVLSLPAAPDFPPVTLRERMPANALRPRGEASVVDLAGGRPILIPSQPAVQDRYAAELLSHFLQALYGEEFPVLPDKVRMGGPFLSVGNTSRAQAAGFALLEDWQGYSLAEREGNLFFLGGRNGALYAVLALLQEDLGCRFYALGDPVLAPVPSGKRLSFVPRSYAPPFEIREPLNGESHRLMSWLPDPDHFNAFNRVQAVSYFKALPPEMGGGFSNTEYFIHTYEPLIPASRFFSTHPEYFPLRDGRRQSVTGTTGQLCYTNPGVAREMAEQLEQALEKAPYARVYSISHNDNNAMTCQCDACQALEKQEGLSALTLQLANQVAQRISLRQPEARITTLAYVETQPLPKTLRPHPNTVIFYAPIRQRGGVNAMLPWEEVPSIVSEIQGWCDASRMVYVWDYLIAKEIQPHFDLISQNIDYWKRLGVKGVFLEDQEFCLNSLESMKNWVFMQKLWNPDWDLHALMEEFLEGHYGEAAPWMRQYVALLQTAWRNWHQDTTRPAGSVMRLTPEEIRECDRLLEEAYQALPGDAVAAEIVAFNAPVLEYCAPGETEAFQKRLARTRELLQRHGLRLDERQQTPNDHFLQAWEKTLQEAREGFTFPVYGPGSLFLKERYARLPGVEEIQAEGSFLPTVLKQTKGTDWGVQWPFARLLRGATNQATYVVRIRVKPHFTRPHHPDSPAFSLHLYRSGFEGTSQHSTQGRFVTFRELENDQWQFLPLYRIYMYSPSLDGYFYNCIGNLQDSEYMLYDLVEFIPEESFQEKEILETLPLVTF
ncbi:MAG: DUF4838 domain-containing protein [Oligosphaeraceae bacterium]